MLRSMWPAVVALLLLSVLVGCAPATEPPSAHVAVFTGGPYERGLDHGTRFSSQIHSLYTRLLTSSLIPYLNREQLSIAPVLVVYNRPEYRDGQFSGRMLLESGQALVDGGFIPDEYIQEMLGIADGAGMTFDEILILNTFFDSMMGFRAIVSFIQEIQRPYIVLVEAVADCDGDGFDNDGDGVVDGEGDCASEEYGSTDRGTLIEVPVDASIRIVIKDPTLPGLACIDPRNVEPLGEDVIARSCVKPECLVSACGDLDLVGRDCFNAQGLGCIDPRVAGVCLDPLCAEPTDPGCVDPDSIRIRLDEVQYTAADAAIVTAHLPREEGVEPLEDPDHPYARICDFPLEVVFTPPGGLPPASLVTLKIQAADRSPVYSPPPFHTRAMRAEQVAFTTAGYHGKTGRGAVPDEVDNVGVDDPGVMPPSLGFAARGGATPTGAPVLGHHFALLDSDMLHEHSLVSVHIPDEGRPHVLVGYTGLVWGFSGMNTEGLTWAFTNSDTLDNPLVGAALDAIFLPENLLRLLQSPDLVGLSKALEETYLNTRGTPIGLTGRLVLQGAADVEGAVEVLYGLDRTYGWNMLLADASGAIAVVEVDSHVQADDDDVGRDRVQDEDGFRIYTPDPELPGNLDGRGTPWASVGADDIRMGSHFEKNRDDMVDLSIMGIFAPRRQRGWTGFYFRSLRAFHRLGEEIDDRYGDLDAAAAMEILRTPALVDTRDSMCASVYEPARAVLHWAMGEAPATDAPFVELDLGQLVRDGGAR
ncbi:MAG: carcinine hydrolase/isopenicillin-N N-acyltransferase family protein [Pseudomonadota bacterium]